jgi:hypothetical protein
MVGLHDARVEDPFDSVLDGAGLGIERELTAVLFEDSQ